eukprot:COSAG06_NODE_1297_length_9956_cov_20.957796_8_plen_311_part_00
MNGHHLPRMPRPAPPRIAQQIGVKNLPAWAATRDDWWADGAVPRVRTRSHLTPTPQRAVTAVQFSQTKRRGAGGTDALEPLFTCPTRRAFPFEFWARTSSTHRVTVPRSSGWQTTRAHAAVRTAGLPVTVLMDIWPRTSDRTVLRRKPALGRRSVGHSPNVVVAHASLSLDGVSLGSPVQPQRKRRPGESSSADITNRDALQAKQTSVMPIVCPSRTDDPTYPGRYIDMSEGEQVSSSLPATGSAAVLSHRRTTSPASPRIYTDPIHSVNDAATRSTATGATLVGQEGGLVELSLTVSGNGSRNRETQFH